MRKVVRGDETSFSYERKALHEAARVPPIDYRDNLRRAAQMGSILHADRGSSVDASVDANVSGHVVRCCHLSGLMMRLV